MMPAPADLTYFIETANTLNVSRAAERLGISQPSLSLALRRLEQSTGATLLTRGKRGVALTPAGKALLIQARHLLQTWDSVRASAQTSVSEVRGLYTLGCHSSVALSSLGAFMPALMAQHPGLEIRLYHDVSRKITEDVISAKADIGIVVNPVRHPDLVIHRLRDDETTLWASPQNKAPDVLICDTDLPQTQTILKQLSKSGVTFRRTMSSSDLEVVADLAAHGCGTAILPSRIAERARKPLRRIPKMPALQSDHCILYRVENKGVKSIQAMSEAARNYFKKNQ